MYVVENERLCPSIRSRTRTTEYLGVKTLQQQEYLTTWTMLIPEPSEFELPIASSCANDPSHQALIESLNKEIYRVRSLTRKKGEYGYDAKTGAFEEAHPFPTALDVIRMTFIPPYVKDKQVLGEDYHHQGFKPFTTLELKVWQMLAAVKDKERWYEKFEDEQIWANYVKDFKSWLEEESLDLGVGVDGNSDSGSNEGSEWGDDVSIDDKEDEQAEEGELYENDRDEDDEESKDDESMKDVDDTGPREESTDKGDDPLAQFKLVFSKELEKFLKDALRWDVEVGRKRPGGPYEEIIECVFKSDELVPEILRQRLLDGVRRFEDKAGVKNSEWYKELQKTRTANRQEYSCEDYNCNKPDCEGHYDFNDADLVLDLVHPSMYPIVYNETKYVPGGFELNDAIRNIGKGEPIPPPPGVAAWNCVEKRITSERFQWLPTEFVIDDDGTAHVDSYINNLHPEHHKELYKSIEEVFTKCIPLLSATLKGVINKQDIFVGEDYYPFRVVTRDEFHAVPTTFQHQDDESYDEWQVEEVKEGVISEEERLQDMEEHEYRIYSPPTVKPFQPKPDWQTVDIDLARFKRLQVIVKLANIELDPVNSAFNGGDWHVEGMTNEAIVATAIYYFSNDNVEGGTINFRQSIAAPSYDQSERRAIKHAYDKTEGDNNIQNLNFVNTREGRILTFPNLFQHAVGECDLKDDTRPGSRRILAFFLVDPFNPIPSSRDVPPQQRDWWIEELCKNDG